MGNVAIHAEEISKKYKIGARQARYKTLRESLSETVASPFRRMGHLLSNRRNGVSHTQETIWALKDVSFEIEHGEVIGIIGRNGAGKSTLLKILSRITEPTEGSARLYGRVGSLLEVGTGFHPELTGRENIYLNGAILGMKRGEIDRKFDEIVVFAEIEKFIDTPVKHYSSGMYLRLAFAVAAHMEPEILIVDEVLAVGDYEFQKKCLGKMEDVSKAGRTILFVSHNMAAIDSLCSKCIYLESGNVKLIDETAKVIPLYIGESSDSRRDRGLRISSHIENGKWRKGSKLNIRIAWEKYRFAPGWSCDIALKTINGAKLAAAQSSKIPGFSSSDPEHNSVTFQIENVGLNEKPVRLDVGIRNRIEDANYSVFLSDCLVLLPNASDLPLYAPLSQDILLRPDISCKVGIADSANRKRSFEAIDSL